MTGGNYAPFYRSGYFNPMQGMMDNQYVQPYGQQMANQPLQNMQQLLATAPNNDMLWVLNEMEATSYPVAPGNSVTLWDKNQDTVYIKSMNAQGVPSMRILDYVERTAETQKQPEKHVCKCSKEFVPFSTFDTLVERIDIMDARLGELAAATKPKTKAKEEVENG